MPTPDQLYDAIEGTWPPADTWVDGPWRYREGQGGGKRVAATLAAGPSAADAVEEAVAKMGARGEQPMFMIREGEEDLDAALAQAGMEVIDPVNLYACPISNLTQQPIPPVTAFCIWEPLAIMRELWAAGGIGPARLAIMDRAHGKTAILGRINAKPAGVAFAAVHADICMVHAVEVAPAHRRQGLAAWMMRQAAFWGQAQGARHIAVLCVVENAPANALYRRLGFELSGRYHYRIAS